MAFTLLILSFCSISVKYHVRGDYVYPQEFGSEDGSSSEWEESSSDISEDLEIWFV